MNHRLIVSRIFSELKYFSLLFILSDKEQEEKILQAITAARKKVKGEIQELTDKLKQNKETKQKLREELAKLEDKGY